MRSTTGFILWITLFLVGHYSTIGQTIPRTANLQASLKPSQNIGKDTSPTTIWNEDVDARTVTSSTYYSDDGQVRVIYSSRPINYYTSANELVPINAELVQLDESTWHAPQQPFPTHLFSDGSFSINLGGDQQFTLGKNCKIGTQQSNASFVFTGDTVTLYEVVPGIDKQLLFRENGVKYNYIIQQALTNGVPAIFSEEIELPEGYTIHRDETYGEETKEGWWTGNLIVQDKLGNAVSTLHLPVCFDQNNAVARAAYSTRKKNGKQLLEIHVPEDWLNSPSRAYPIIVDPIITGPMNTWAGGSMPSCMSPNFNQDSILITIPGGITVTDLNVTASFYADPFTSAIMSNGIMYFSSGCDNSQNFTITGTPGNSAGTAYLDSYDLHNPLTCCYPESCNDTSFWLSMHLARTVLGTGCNTTYIRYDPATTSWPFQAEVIGRTPETYGGQWFVPLSEICSSDCSIIGTAYAYYGVAPYTFTHPWSNDTVVSGQNTGCGNGSTFNVFDLTIPNCPNFCDTNFTSLDVPPATVVDACGQVVGGMPTRTVPIKTAPGITAIYDTLVCSNENFVIDLESCFPQATISWEGNGTSGNSDISQSITNTSGSYTSTSYTASAEYDGCYSDTLSLPLSVQPLPNVDFSTDPSPIVSGLDASFTDQTVFSIGNGSFWGWTFGDGAESFEQNPTYMYSSPGEYEVCLIVVENSECQDSICKLLPVVPAEIVRPNIVTPNNDGINDLLVFQYLDFYPDNELLIFNRWGNLIHQQSGYTNDWNGANYVEGTYFYILRIKEIDKEYDGFFQLEK